jgi:flagellin
MGLVVNTNIASINAQRQLSSSGADLDQASERLASGKRINSAADDAAGLAIANRQTSQIRGLDQAIRNANDGISLIQTAEGALDATSNILQRVRELSVQSSNGIYSDTDRATLNAEVEQLTAELDRIAESTTFNGLNILDGSLGSLKLQVGSEAGDTIGIEVQGFSANSLGGAAGGDVVGAASVNGLVAALAVVEDVTADAQLSINGQSVGDLSTVGANLSDQLATINQNVSGVEVSAFVEAAATVAGDGIIRGTSSVNLSIVLQDGTTTTLQIANTGSLEEVAAQINEQGGSAVQASINDDGLLVLSSDVATSIATADNTATSLAALGLAAGTTEAQLSFDITDSSVTSVDVVYAGTNLDADAIADIGVQARDKGDITGAVQTGFTIVAEGDLVINGVEIGATAVATDAPEQGEALKDAINLKSADTGVVASFAATGELTLNSVDGSEISIDFAGTSATTAITGLIETNNAVSQGNTVADIDISTQAGAQAAIDVVDVALEQINSQRADLGAINNRLDFTVSNLSNVSENTSAARSRIMDADFASETAELSRAQVLQQASQAILAQANARPQQVLSLLN